MVWFCYLLLFLCLKLPPTLFICVELICKSHFQLHRSLRAFGSMTFQMSMMLADHTKGYVTKPFRGRIPLGHGKENTANRLRREALGCGDGAAFVFLIPTYELKRNVSWKERINRSEGGTGISVTCLG